MLFSDKFLHIPKSAFSSRVDAFLKQKRFTLEVNYPMIDTFPHGAPLGGFGAGTFIRDVAGDFSLWHLFSGAHIQDPLKACKIAVYQKKGKKKYAYALSNNSSTIFSTWAAIPAKKVTYQAQYPKSWYHYDLPATVTIEQFSPILPHNYKETSLPAACFIAQCHNPSQETIEVSILISWQNILGWGYNNEQGPTKNTFIKKIVPRTNTRAESYEYKGIVFRADNSNYKENLWGEWCLATKEIEGARVSFLTTYDANQDGHEVWDHFSNSGILQDTVRKNLTDPAGAIAVKIELNPGQSLKIPFALTWDIPYSNKGRTEKYYTRYFDTQGNNAFALAKHALKNIHHYSDQINDWFAEYATLPAWLTRGLFNELYFLADGGSLWDAKTGKFTYLECYDYLFYETLDVRYYGAYPLALFWPEIEKSILQDFSNSVTFEDTRKVDYHVSLSTINKNSVAGQLNKQFIQRDQRKRKNALPHDLGSPPEDVWNELNAYTWQNANRWKDLNSKYVLQLYRAYYYSGKKDRAFLAKNWTALQKAIDYLDELDFDGDHLPENESFPDQTFDNWLMVGTSAYCGILRLASLQTIIQIADILEKKEDAIHYRRMLKNAKDSLYKKLWNGTYFAFDQKTPAIMAAQLMGQWYLDQMHLPGVIAPQDIHTAYQSIYQHNFKNYYNGRYGLVNGRMPDDTATNCPQGNNVWVGVNFAVAAHLILIGEEKQGLTIAKTILSIIENRGFLFRTPEAWSGEDSFLATMYMRPGSIWAIADALLNTRK